MKAYSSWNILQTVANDWLIPPHIIIYMLIKIYSSSYNTTINTTTVTTIYISRARATAHPYIWTLLHDWVHNATIKVTWLVCCKGHTIAFTSLCASCSDSNRRVHCGTIWAEWDHRRGSIGVGSARSQISSTCKFEIAWMHTIRLTINWATLVVRHRNRVKPFMASAPFSCFPQSHPQVLATLNNVNNYTCIIVQVLWSYTCPTHSLGCVTDILCIHHNILSSRHSCIIKL